MWNNLQRSCMEISCFGIVCRDKKRKNYLVSPFSSPVSCQSISMEHVCSHTSDLAPGSSGQQLKKPGGISCVPLSPDVVGVVTASRSLVKKGLSVNWIFSFVLECAQWRPGQSPTWEAWGFVSVRTRQYRTASLSFVQMSDGSEEVRAK